MTVADDLRGGANYIREHGHAKGTAEAKGGSVCAMGGIARSLGLGVEVCYRNFEFPDDLEFRFGQAVLALRNYLIDNGVRWREPVPDWNDHTSADDVVTGMEKAAAWVEEKA